MTSHLNTREMTSVPLEVKAEGENGTFEGYGAIFGNLDRDGDVVSRGAFSESLKGRMPALLWQHNAREPIGRFDVVREDAKGLYVKGRLSMEGRGREAYDLLKMGALDGLSIGFVTREASRDATTGTRTITKADLMEISLVTFPANELARVSTVKSSGLNLETPRDFERFLRDSGFSRSRAKAITAKGFGGVGGSSGDEMLPEMIQGLFQRRARLETAFCGPDCVGCEPCRSTQKGAYAATCETLRNDIRAGNRSRWRAWQDLDRKIKRLSIAAQKFARERNIGLAIDGLFTGIDVIRAAASRRPQDVVQAVASVVALIKKIKRSNEGYASDMRRALLDELTQVEIAQKRAVDLEDSFRKQVNAFERNDCGTLSSSDFNRP